MKLLSSQTTSEILNRWPGPIFEKVTKIEEIEGNGVYALAVER